MGKAPVWVNIGGAEELKRLSKELRKAPKELRREFRQELKDAGKPVIADTRRAALAAEVSSSRGGHARPDKSTGLRAAVAKAIGLSITSSGIRIQVSRAKLAKTHDPNLARYLDRVPFGKYRRWRHPVFGNKKVWAEQTGDPFFYTTIRKHAPRFRQACHQAMSNVAARITKG